MYFNFEKVLLYKVYIRYSYQFFYFLLTWVMISVNIIFHSVLELRSTLSEKDFRRKSPFFNWFTQLHTPWPPKWPKSARFDKRFLSIFSKMPSETFFFKILLTKSCKSIFHVSAVNCHCHCIFKGSSYRFSGPLFRHVLRTAILTQASIIAC